MRFLHTSDWHLGHTLKGWSRSEEHAAFLGWLEGALVQEEIDVLLVAGDIFDTANPSAAAQETWYAFLARARRRNPDLDIVVIGGNHDSASRLDAPNPLLRALGVHVVGGFLRLGERVQDIDSLLVPVTGRDGERAIVAAVPFLRPPDLPVLEVGEDDALVEGVRAVYREVTDRALTRSSGGAIVAMGHLYMAGGELSELSERRILGGNQHALPVDLFPPELVYVALGHLHRAQRLGDGRVRYSGSPIPLSMAEAGYPHQVVLVDVRGGVLESSRALHVPHRVEMMRIPEAGSAALPEVILAIKELPERSTIEESLRPFLDVEIRREKPEPGLQQQILDAVSDRAVRLVRIATVDTGGKLPLADALRGKTLDALTPEQVFVERHRRHYEAPPTPELIAAFHELLAVAHAGAS